MPREVRRKSESGIYHIILRGINQQRIFEDSEDCEKFLQILKDCKAVSEYKLFALCLMGNHIHLLVQEDEEAIDQVMKRLKPDLFIGIILNTDESGICLKIDLKVNLSRMMRIL